MRIAIIEQGQRVYLMETFSRHPELNAKICCFVEKQPKSEEYKKIPVICLTELEKTEFDILLVAIASNNYLSHLLVWLHDHQIQNIYVLRLFALQTHPDFIAGTKFNMVYIDKISETEERPYLVHLETHVCDHCNLNCKACNNFSPFVKERQVTDVVQYDKDMQNLAVLFSNIGRLFLLGGEPLLESELCCKMIEISRKYFPNAELRVLTNATLILGMKPEFWECLRKNNVIIHISAYPPIRNILPNIIEKIRSENVAYIVIKVAEKFSRRLTHHLNEDADYNNEHCGAAGCHYLRAGVLAKCPDAILIGNMASAMKCNPEKLQPKQILKLSDFKDPWKIIRELNQPNDLCKRCSIQKMKLFPWEMAGTNPDPEDWFIESQLEQENHELQAKVVSLTKERNQLKAELEKNEHEKRKLKADADRQLAENICAQERLQNSLCEQQHLYNEKKDALIKRENEVSNWKLQYDRLSEQLDDKTSQLKKWQGECDLITKSLSFRVGRFITFIPRMIRKALCG